MSSFVHLPDVDECGNVEENECHLNAMCTNTEGLYVCRCKKGYVGDGKNCTGEDFWSCSEWNDL